MNRGDAFMKTQQWDLATRDLTTAISLQVGGVSLLMNIKQFRALYPEYKTASNEAIARKINKTFYPNMNHEDFSKGFLDETRDFGSQPRFRICISNGLTPISGKMIGPGHPLNFAGPSMVFRSIPRLLSDGEN